jgi:polyisoprenoid-binding protein YceI
MRRLLMLTFAAMLAVTSAPAMAQGFVVDKSHSNIGFSANHFGFSMVRGRFREFDMTVDFDPENVAATRVEMVIDVNSVDTNWPERDRYLKFPEFFDAANHPQITFVSEEVTPVGEDEATILGQLTMRGVTQEVELTAELIKAGPSPFDPSKEIYGFRVSGEVDRTAFGVSYAAPGVGAIVPILLDIELISAN